MKKHSTTKRGFTLAEIMVVLFIMTIILAAFAPLMTVRAKSTSRTSPWNWATPDSANTYFGVHPNQRVMIGQKTKGSDMSNKLTINTTDGEAHMLLKENGVLKAQLYANRGNIILGGHTQTIQITGDSNAALGVGTLSSNTSGSANVAVGANALNKNTSGIQNVAIGVTAGYINSTGHYNTALGSGALYHNQGGSYNTALGYFSCFNLYNSRNTCVGAYSGPNNTDTNANNVYIGNQYSKVYVYGTTELKNLISSSDIRLKNVQGDYTSGLEQIKKIKPVQFTFKDDKKKTPRVGVIAQDLQKIFPKAVMKGDDGFLKIRQEDMFYAMVNAIKELANRVEAKDKKIKELEKRIKQLEKVLS